MTGLAADATTLGWSYKIGYAAGDFGSNLHFTFAHVFVVHA